MRVSGFTFIRNGTMLGYPFVESIRSALPLCDETHTARPWWLRSPAPMIQIPQRRTGFSVSPDDVI